MEMQWDKVPERLHSESMKCLFCHSMAKKLHITNDFRASITYCCSLMLVALTMDDDEAFENEMKLMQALICNSGPMSEDAVAFLHQHKEYFLECTTRVLETVRNCPDKPYNRKR